MQDNSLQSHDFSIHASEHFDSSDNSIGPSLARKLATIKQDKTILRLKLHNFVNSYTTQQCDGIKDIIKGDKKRPWKWIKFQDTVQGDHYRRWLFKKQGVIRKLVELEDSHPEFELRFDTQVEIDFDVMNKWTIITLLRAIRDDMEVTSLSFRGYIRREDVEEIVECISGLVACDERSWEKIVFHTSFAGESCHYRQWNRTMKKYTRSLEALSIEYLIPVGVKICENR